MGGTMHKPVVLQYCYKKIKKTKQTKTRPDCMKKGEELISKYNGLYTYK